MRNFVRGARGSVCALALVAASLAARALDIGGAVIVEHIDRTGEQFLLANAGNDVTHFVQGNLNFSHDFTRDYHGFARVVAAGGTLGLDEAWLSADVLPYQGTITVGRFRKPGGSPLLTPGLSFASLIYHSQLNTGVKIDMEHDVWNWEAGLVNHQALSAFGSVLGATPGFGRPNVLNTNADNSYDLYGYLGWKAGGSWGSLQARGTGLYGDMTKADRDLLRGLDITKTGVSSSSFSDNNRHYWSGALDYTNGPWRAFGEYLREHLGELPVKTWNVGGAYRWNDYEFTLRGDILKVSAERSRLAIPASWDRQVLGGGVTYFYRPNIQFQAYYEESQEQINNLGANDSIIRSKGIKNNTATLQMLAFF